MNCVALRGHGHGYWDTATRLLAFVPATTMMFPMNNQHLTRCMCAFSDRRSDLDCVRMRAAISLCVFHVMRSLKHSWFVQFVSSLQGFAHIISATMFQSFCASGFKHLCWKVFVHWSRQAHGPVGLVENVLRMYTGQEFCAKLRCVL